MVLSEKQKMLSGLAYQASDPQLVAERELAHARCRSYSADGDPSPTGLLPLIEIFGRVGKDLYIEPPFFCDYGYNIRLGHRVYLNTDVTILDCAPVIIGSDVKFGPGVQIYTAGHSLDPGRRAAGDEFAQPITIENNVWVGGAAVILPGIAIGRDTVIGAGSVVTQDIPSGVVAAGNPARIIRPG